MYPRSPQSTTTADIAIIGAGAAGLAAAIFAGEESQRQSTRRKIILLDGAKKPGAKILVSGGGRCNVTNESVTEQDYCGGSPNIIRNVLRRFDERSTVQWMESLGVELKAEPTRKLFPVTDSARTVLNALMNRVREVGVETRFGFRVSEVQRSVKAKGTETLWLILSASGETLSARKIIIATGGKALPKSGSDGAGYVWLKRFGHTIIPPVPALAPLILDEHGIDGSPLSHAFASLSGLTINARLSFAPKGNSTTASKPKSGKRLQPIMASAHYDGSLLFTHFGLSGPAAMNLSRHLARYRQVASSENRDAWKDRVTIGFELPGIGFPGSVEVADQWLLHAAEKSPRITVTGAIARALPERLAQLLASAVSQQAQNVEQSSQVDKFEVAQAFLPSKRPASKITPTIKSTQSPKSLRESPQQRRDAAATLTATTAHLGNLPRQQRQRLAQLLYGSPLAVKGDRGFSFAEATAGGVALDEINWRTMESRKAPGLYLCGEVLDVDGRIGGFNFQWAWSSAHIAGTAAASIS